MDVVIPIVYNAALISMAYILWACMRKVNWVQDELARIEWSQRNDHKEINGVIATTKRNIEADAKSNLHHFEAIQEAQHKFDSELTWLKMELSNLSKDVKELSNEIFGDGVADEVVESEKGINYFYDRGLFGKVAHALDRIAKLNDKVETYYLANNNYHVSIGKQVSSLKAKLDK